MKEQKTNFLIEFFYAQDDKINGITQLINWKSLLLILKSLRSRFSRIRNISYETVAKQPYSNYNDHPHSCSSQARIQGRWNGWIFTLLFLSPSSIMLMHRPQTPQPGFGSITLLQKFTPHFKILDPRLLRLHDSRSNLEMLVFEERVKPELPEKNLRRKRENQKQTQPTYGVDTGIWTRATLLGGECSRHWATLAPLLLIIYCL